MKFGIFYELQLPRPWEPDSELTLFYVYQEVRRTWLPRGDQWLSNRRAIDPGS
jgi:hypothetical protein